MGKVLPLEGQKEVLGDILPVLPGSIRALLEEMDGKVMGMLEEIRLREGKPLMVGLGDGDRFVTRQGGLSPGWENAYLVTREDMSKTLHLISSSSFYALEEELKKGFLTLKGGHRVGLTGRVVLDKGQIKTMKDISAFNFRLARQIFRAADQVLPKLINHPTGEIYNTLIISPPRCGKTTLLRDVIRQLSEGVPALGFSGMTVGLVDERSELAACYEGVPQLDVGVRTDVLDACPKAEGMMMLIRSMAPGIIASDEIGRLEDAEALLEAVHTGIKVISTAHGKDLTDFAARPSLRGLFEEQVFERYIILGRSRGVGTVEVILGSGREPLN